MDLDRKLDLDLKRKGQPSLAQDLLVVATLDAHAVEKEVRCLHPGVPEVPAMKAPGERLLPGKELRAGPGGVIP